MICKYCKFFDPRTSKQIDVWIGTCEIKLPKWVHDAAGGDSNRVVRADDGCDIGEAK